MGFLMLVALIYLFIMVTFVLRNAEVAGESSQPGCLRALVTGASSV